MDAKIDGSEHSEVCSGRSSFAPSRSNRRPILRQPKSQSTSALDTSPSSGREYKPKPERRRSLDNSSTATSRSRRTKEKSNQQQTKELLMKQQKRRGSLDSYSAKTHRSSTTSDQHFGGASDHRLRTSDHSAATNSVSRFSTNPRRRLSLQHQQSLSSVQNNTTPNIGSNVNKKVVVHTCDDKGRCIFHPNIQLRKKSLMGVGGWKDILTACPECEKQELKEFVKREKEEIMKLESMLGRLDQHDVEYLNDDGMDNDGNYLPFASGAGPANSSLHQKHEGPRLVQITFTEGCELPGSSSKISSLRRRNSIH